MVDPAYPGTERRSLSEEKVAMMIEEAVDDAMGKHEQRITSMFKAEFGQLHALITAAFPNGDVHGHKIAHEAQIDSARWWKQLKADFITKAFTTGMLAALVFVAIAVWESVKGEVKK